MLDCQNTSALCVMLDTACIYKPKTRLHHSNQAVSVLGEAEVLFIPLKCGPTALSEFIDICTCVHCCFTSEL